RSPYRHRALILDVSHEPIGCQCPIPPSLVFRESTLSGHRFPVFCPGGGRGSVVSRTLVPEGARFGGLGSFWK
ncbi:MAG: hypothetical protein WB686_00750, partial [Pseudolabrys sp.]